MNVDRFHVDEKNDEFLHRKLGNLDTGSYGQCNKFKGGAHAGFLASDSCLLTLENP